MNKKSILKKLFNQDNYGLKLDHNIVMQLSQLAFKKKIPLNQLTHNLTIVLFKVKIIKEEINFIMKKKQTICQD